MFMQTLKYAGRVLLLAFPLGVVPAWALTLTETAKLLASDGTANHFFGRPVAVDGDTAVIGALGDDDNGSFSGSAYVFTRDGAGVWSEQAKLLASDGAANDHFGGSSVAVDGDTAVIGAQNDDDNGSSSGSAYVFTRDGAGVWSEQAKLLASDGASSDQLGRSVAVDGDTAVIGAHQDDDNGIESGSAYVFTRDGGGVWTEQDKLIASDGAAIDFFGRSVAVNGDTALIGAHQDDDNGSSSGSAYVFTRDGAGVWSEQAKLLASDGASGDLLGRSVAVDGDTAVIGAPGFVFGAAYVFTRDGAGVWSEQAMLLASDGAQGDQFGFSVAVNGDKALIGAYLDDDNGSSSGSAYLFTRDGAGVWSEQAKLLASDGAQGDQFGRFVAVSGDTALIGADLDGSQTGAAYVFVTPSEATQNLINTILGLGLPNNVENPLRAPLKNVLKILQDNNPANDSAACGKLDEFIANVNAKESSGQLSAANATLLREAAQTIKTSLDCP